MGVFNGTAVWVQPQNSLHDLNKEALLMQFGTCIGGIGIYIPDEVRTNDFWPDHVVAEWVRARESLEGLKGDAQTSAHHIHPALKKELVKLKGDPFAGLARRRVAPERMLPSDMEKMAATMAMESAHVSPEDVDAIMSFSIPPDETEYPNAYRIHRDLGLKNAVAFAVVGLCHSVAYMTDIADRYISSGRYRNVLAVASAKYSNVADYTDQLSGMMGDGAVAFVLTRCPKGVGIIASCHRTDSEFTDSLAFEERLPKIPTPVHSNYGPQQMQYRFYMTNRDPESTKHMFARLPYWAQSTCRPVLDSTGMTPGDVDVLITNAATAYYAKAVANILEIDESKIEDNVMEFNNMGPSNWGVNLYTALRSGRIRSGSRVLVFSHGGGANYGAFVILWP
jgi:3-oxoacyl-[acyl-carrier-protein] synthase-3